MSNDRASASMKRRGCGPVVGVWLLGSFAALAYAYVLGRRIAKRKPASTRRVRLSA